MICIAEHEKIAMELVLNQVLLMDDTVYRNDKRPRMVQDHDKGFPLSEPAGSCMIFHRIRE